MMNNKNINLSFLPCHQLTGVGKRTAERLSNLGIQSIQDILFHLPMRYQDRTRIIPIGRLKAGDHVVIEGTIESVTTPPRVGKTRLLCRMCDETGRMTLRFFHATGFQRQQLQVGGRIRCFGEVRLGMQGLEMIHPEYYLLNAEVLLPIEENLTPIYPTTEGLSQLTWRRLTEQALQLLLKGGALEDILPAKILASLDFPSLSQALHFVHRPPAEAEVNLLMEGKHVTQKRLVFEELLAQRLSLLNVKSTFKQQEGFALRESAILKDKFLAALPFELTDAQQRVSQEIEQDLIESRPMLRLVQGDVGSGKTVVAALAILQALESDFQSALLAPTELLAEQHFQTFKKWFEPLGIQVVLLSSQLKISARRLALTAIADGQAQVIIGTHAIFQKKVAFAKLALIIVDEQHRFGVEQRALLREKGYQNNKYPHQLIMTATPIPRTLAMSVYADLDCSVIDELPPGRTPVTTIALSATRRPEVLERIREGCNEGRQAYWVCTLIEESEVLQCQAAENTAQELQTALTGLKVGLIHGRMKAQDKEATMAAFKNNELQLLVATTVIEVGVDVPNASLMVIENVERLGLAQLHQLRGRVGRGAVASHCVLMYHHLSSLGKERLAVMRETTDGFKIAQRDLEIRGPGEVLGTRQTGEIGLRIADLLRDQELLPTVQEAADLVLKDYAEVIQPLIKRWLGSKEKFGQV